MPARKPSTFCISMHVHLIKQENQLQFKFNFHFVKMVFDISVSHLLNFIICIFLGCTPNADEVNANCVDRQQHSTMLN